MKKICALLLALLLLLSGCAGESGGATSAPSAGTETTVARQAPETTIPTDSAVTEANAAQTEASTAAPDTLPETEPAPATDTDTSEEASTAEPVTEEIETEAPPTLEPVDPWSLVGVSFFDQGFYTDELGNEETWGYEIPCLKAETPGAEEINNRIDATFGEMVRESQRSMEYGESLSFVHCGFRAMVWEDVLILDLIGHMSWDYTEYGIYCYEYTTGRYLDTRALLKKMGYSQQEFLETVTRQSTEFYKDEYASLPEDMREDNGYYEGLKRMQNGEFVNLDLMTYPDENGDLVVIVPIVSLAGPDYFYEEIYLGMGHMG